jgi:lipid-A-disaccharide synthase-like uncharacterized protein
MLKKRRPQEYKLRAFVGILFLSIAFLVGFAYVYHQQVLQVCWLQIHTLIGALNLLYLVYTMKEVMRL